jgi:hypothetical protein
LSVVFGWLGQRYYHHSCRDMSVVTTGEELDVKLKVARCYVQLDCIHEAIEVVPLLTMCWSAGRVGLQLTEADVVLTVVEIDAASC